MKKPLEGIKILDFTQFFSGPLCTLLLSDMGAEVIKLENPPIGDSSRYNPEIIGKNGSNFATRNRGKKSVLIDLKDERQRSIFLKMVETADAVVENYKPGTLEKFGITYDVLRAINPKIVLTSISGYGQNGPYRDHAAYDGAVQCEAGIVSITGEEGHEGVRTGPLIGDASSGYAACVGTLAALMDARESGVGRHVDISMMDVLVTYMENYITRYNAVGYVQKPGGNALYSSAPFNAFSCRDGGKVYIGIGTDGQYAKLCEIVGHKEWITDPKCISTSVRVKNRDYVEGILQEVLLSDWDTDSICEKLQEARLVWGRINTVAEVAKHPQVIARKMLVDAVFDDGTVFRTPGCAIKMSGLEYEDTYHTSALGQDTFEVLAPYASKEELHQIYDPIMVQVDEVVAKKTAK